MNLPTFTPMLNTMIDWLTWIYCYWHLWHMFLLQMLVQHLWCNYYNDLVCLTCCSSVVTRNSVDPLRLCIPNPITFNRIVYLWNSLPPLFRQKQHLSVFKRTPFTSFLIVYFAAILTVQILAHGRYIADVPNADYRFLVLCRGDYISLYRLLHFIVFLFNLCHDFYSIVKCILSSHSYLVSQVLSLSNIHMFTIINIC